MAILLMVVGLTDVVTELMGGWNWWAALFCLVESPLTVFGSVWLLAEAQRHLRRRFWWGPALTRSSYAAFIMQGIVLIGAALVLRPVPLPAELKAVLVATAGVIGSFGLGWLLVTRVPGVARVL
jgi:hypothetical protein